MPDCADVGNGTLCDYLNILPVIGLSAACGFFGGEAATGADASAFRRTVIHPDHPIRMFMPAAASCASPRTALYRRRPERTVLYRTVQTHLATWLELTADTPQGGSGPSHVEREFRRYLGMRHPRPRLCLRPLCGARPRLPHRLFLQGPGRMSGLQRPVHGGA